MNVKNGAWHHVVGQYTGSQLQLYLDGVLKVSVARTGSISYTLGTGFYLGKHGNGATNRDFNGPIDQVRVYARALTTTEISALATETALSAYDNLVLIAGPVAFTTRSPSTRPIRSARATAP